MLRYEQPELKTQQLAQCRASEIGTFELVTDPLRFLLLKPAWDDLWRRSSAAGLFQSFDCCLHIWQAIAAPQHYRLFCLVSWDGREMTGAWPLMVCRQRAWRFLRPLDATGAEMTRFLLDDNVDEQEWVAAACRILQQQSPCDVVCLPYVQANSRLSQNLSRLSQQASVEFGVSVYASFRNEADWNSYYDSLSKGHRKQQLRCQKRLSEQGSLKFEVVEAGDRRCPGLIKWMFAQKRVWGKKVDRNGHWLYSRHYQDFLDRLMTANADDTRCFLLLLTLDGEPLAVKLAAKGKSRSVVELLISGFDAAYEKYSPGIRLDEYVVRWCVEQKLDCDFGSGGERSKKFWTRGHTIDVVTFHIPVSPWGQLFLRLRKQLSTLRDRKQKQLESRPLATSHQRENAPVTADQSHLEVGA